MKISIIICTYNRAKGIVAALDSIAQSLTAAAPVEGEIVIVDNASTDDTPAIIKKWAEVCPFPVQLVRETKKGVSAARNSGVRAAKGDLLVITDDDCRLSKSHITEALRHDAADSEPVLRGGRVELGDPTDMPITIITDTEVMRWQHVKGSKYIPLGSGLILGCNMSMRRTLVDRIGFFEERFGAGTGIPAGEETDYIFRTYLAGIPIEYVPDMTVYHFHGRKTAAEGKKLFENYAVGEGALYAKYLFKEPNLCRQLYWDIRDMVKDMLAGKNSHLPDINFSYKDKTLFNLYGIVKYIRIIL